MKKHLRRGNKMNKFEIVLISILISLLIVMLVASLNQFNNLLDEYPINKDKYCDLSRIEGENEMSLYFIYYELEKEVEDYTHGEIIRGNSNGKIKAWGKDLRGYITDYACWFEFEIRKKNIIEKVTIERIFNISEIKELREWRKNA